MQVARCSSLGCIMSFGPTYASPGPLFTKRTDVLPQTLAKSRSREIGCYDDHIALLWNLTGISAALLPRFLSNYRAIGKVKTRTSRLRDFARSCGKTSVRLVTRGSVGAVPLFVVEIQSSTVKPVYNDHLMGYFSAFWSSSRWSRAT